MFVVQFFCEFCMHLFGMWQIEGLEQDRVRLVSDKAELETTLTKVEKSLNDCVTERDDLLAQLDAEKVGLCICWTLLVLTQAGME